MKFRDIGYPYLDLITGYLQTGKYQANGITKISMLRRNNTPILLPTYQKGSKIILKAKPDILGYKLVYYSDKTIFDEENYKFINRFCHDIPKTEALKFLSTHSKELKLVFKNEKTYNQYMLQLVFELGELPYGMELTYKEKLIYNFSLAKEKWKKDKNNFKITSIK